MRRPVPRCALSTSAAAIAKAAVMPAIVSEIGKPVRKGAVWASPVTLMAPRGLARSGRSWARRPRTFLAEAGNRAIHQSRIALGRTSSPRPSRSMTLGREILSTRRLARPSAGTSFPSGALK